MYVPLPLSLTRSHALTQEVNVSPLYLGIRECMAGGADFVAQCYK